MKIKSRKQPNVKIDHDFTKYSWVENFYESAISESGKSKFSIDLGSQIIDIMRFIKYMIIQIHN